MKTVTLKVVFDRKHVADNTKNTGLVQVEVIYDRRQMFISTGIKIFKNQWDKSRMEVKGSLLSEKYNETIKALMGRVTEYKNKCIADGVEFTFEGLRHFLGNGGDDDFLAFMEERIKNRNDITRGTRRMHLSSLNVIKDFGRIRYFSDLSIENITRFDDWLHAKGCAQTTIHGRHKVLKTYINEAVKFDRIGLNPYSKVKIDHGKARDGRIVKEEDMLKIQSCSLPSTLEKIRDLAVFQFYTGLAFSDLMNFDCSKFCDVDGKKMLVNERVKTGETYYVPLFSQTLDSELNRFSDTAILEFIDSLMAGKDEMTTYDIPIQDADQLVLMILAILKCKLNLIPYQAEKVEDRIDYAGYYMPLYRFTRKKRAR